MGGATGRHNGLHWATQYVHLAREVKVKKAEMQVLLKNLGQAVVEGIEIPELGVRLVQKQGRYREYPVEAFFQQFGLQVLLQCVKVDPVKVDEHLRSLPDGEARQMERMLSLLEKVTLQSRHVVEELKSVAK